MSKIQNIADTYESSPFAQRQGLKLKVDDFVEKMRGMHSDHAKDQKKTFKLFQELKAEVCYETLGAEKLVELPLQELNQLLQREELKLILKHGGSTAWKSVLSDIQSKER